ncbi:MAG: hypothetical protein AUG07_08275 [Acidobacteria bacterium 13_1_20CM_2_60_10]|nr:MAG: hypothetical protein AUG07_08275 [Acidobacteria bacterium 13_1_20CM_2_60_10]
MRKIKEVLRLKFEVGLGLRQIARSCSIGLGTAHEYLQRAEASKITWPLGAEWDDDRLEAALFGGPPRSRPTVLPMPDFADLHRQRQRHPHLTQQLLWEEYRRANPDGYRYSRFCELYQRWRRRQDVVLRQEHKAGEKLFVDWAGTTIPIHDPRGGPVLQAHLFVAVLGASSYTYAEAMPDEQLASWIGAHVRAFEFYQGLPKLVVPDNTKTGVTKACRYDPDLNPTDQEMAMHYGVGVVPARPYKPRDKAKVESGVLLVERWIIAALRNRKFFSIEELNHAIRELRDRINQRPFRKREGSRAGLYTSRKRWYAALAMTGLLCVFVVFWITRQSLQSVINAEPIREAGSSFGLKRVSIFNNPINDYHLSRIFCFGACQTTVFWFAFSPNGNWFWSGLNYIDIIPIRFSW